MVGIAPRRIAKVYQELGGVDWSGIAKAGLLKVYRFFIVVVGIAPRRIAKVYQDCWLKRERSFVASALYKIKGQHII
ncbi:MAG: hypothetical protein GY804_00290 [Alphaproteobacteria bacterium]|nr:hypothetical protein [Alphaproteobacteria bacterium]